MLQSGCLLFALATFSTCVLIVVYDLDIVRSVTGSKARCKGVHVDVALVFAFVCQSVCGAARVAEDLFDRVRLCFDVVHVI